MKRDKVDKTVFKAQSSAEAEKSNLFDNDVPLAERWRMAFNLTCTIHGIKGGDPLKVDRTVFSAYKLPDT